jgi:ABC-type transporter Mla subunit MlaD
MGVNLVVFFAFALSSVVMLSRTLVAAVQIDEDIEQAIKPATGGIEANTALLSILGRLQPLTAQIAETAGPLGPLVSQIDTSTSDLNRSVAEVDGSVRSIAAHVDGIDAAVGSITATVNDIAPVVGSSRHQAEGLTDELTGAAAATMAIRSDVGRVNSSLSQILQLPEPLGTTVSGIKVTLETIDGHLVNIQDNIGLQLSNLLLIPRMKDERS